MHTLRGYGDAILDVHPNTSIEISLRQEQEQHDGYCSDPGEFTIETRNEIVRAPLLKLFNADDWYIDPGNKYLEYYLSPGYCGDSCGCCGAKTFVHIIYAKVIKARPA